MIETTIPEIDVTELMQRVRAEAAKIRERNSAQPPSAGGSAVSLPSVRVLPPPPAVVAIRPVNPKRERLDDLLRRARASTVVASWVPKPLRGLFRKQGGFNHELLETVTSLAKTNSELANRVRDLSNAIEGQGRWLNVLADRRAADGAWMRAAEQKLAEMSAGATEHTTAIEELATEHTTAIEDAHEHLKALQGQLDRLGAHVVNLQKQVDAAGELQGQLDRHGVHLHNLQERVDAANAQQHLSALQGQLDRLGAHVVNLQDEVNAVRDTSRSWAEPLRGVERQAEQLGLQINHLEFEIGKNQTDTRFAQRTLDQMASKRSSLEQQLMRMEERNADDAKFLKAIVSEHASLFRRFVAEDTAVLQE